MITPVIYTPGSRGVPSTTNLWVNLRDQIVAYEHTIVARGWYESCALSLRGSIDDMMWWVETMLGGLILISDDDANAVWEGMLTGIEGRFGETSISVTLDNLANQVRCRFTTVTGINATTTNATNATSQTRYGVKEYIESLPQTTLTSAQQLRDARLAERAWPRNRVSDQATTGQQQQSGDITLRGSGWYLLLAWLYAASSTTSTALTTAQVQNLITAYGLTNAFYSSDYTRVSSSGVSATQYIAADQTTYRDQIEKLLNQGNSAGQRLAWGFGDGRKFFARTWAGATPSTTTYLRRAGSGVVRDAYGNSMLPWMVRPDSMCLLEDIVDPMPGSAADGASRFYVERVVCSVARDQISVSLEPTDVDGLGPRLARLERTQYA